MKGLAFGIVAFICVQTIHGTGSNKCSNDLTNLRKEAAQFFTAFQKEHDIAHQDLEFIQFASEMFGGLLDSSASANFGADFELNVLQCILKQFIDMFKVEIVETEKRISHLHCECDLLLDMANIFRFEHNLFCKRGKLTGCDAELNKLRCELGEFFRVLKKAGRRAIVDLRGIEHASHALGRVEKRFSSKYQLTCNQDGTEPQPETSHGNNLNNLKNDLRHLYTEFKRSYDAGQIELVEFSGICNNLTVAIGTWTTKLA